ncbi:hypothetical protein KKQ10_25165 [Pseudomonas sp. MG-9]|uniref:DUF4148 domain-containing protein n=1 Tax=Pseudomonas serboccidentalis TaxID=2964670 RepID=A0ABY7Z4Q8_9PSED|nr:MULTISPECIES: hypothetical protein [Pseudomonas]MBT9268172.1 hypothetical protein [Pseudomonas sp. MG-9]WDR34251.1 hypothetical protein NN484_17205 [Pseudomonas serboccidentalis]
MALLIKLVTSFFLLTLAPNVYATQLTKNQATAKDSGIALYNQSAWTSSQSFLQPAAETGNRDAQYYLGETIHLSNSYMAEEAVK